MDIPYGVIAQLMLINIADDHHPLSRLDDYYKNKDIESLFAMPIDYRKLNDDRFGGLLDAMTAAGCSSLYSDISASAFTHYGIKLGNVNFDTTSKVMWGEYETEEVTTGTIDITFGYSKKKRFESVRLSSLWELPMAIVLMARFSLATMMIRPSMWIISRAVALKTRFDSKKEDFFYIADSAAFTEEFLKKAKGLEMNVITRMPDNINKAKVALQYALEHLDELEKIEIATSTTSSSCLVHDGECIYRGIPLRMATCYSEKLRLQRLQRLAYHQVTICVEAQT